MDEVENPALPAAGEASPTLRPIEEDEDSGDTSNPTKPGLDTVETDGILESGATNPVPTHPPARPQLKRESSAPPPPQQLPPAPPETSEFPQDPPDSLTLADLKRIRQGFPNGQIAQPKQQLLDFDGIYDFEYQDAQSLPVEIEEWFGYSDEEKERLKRCKAVFSDEWKDSGEGQKGADWLDVTEDVRRAFVTEQIEVLAENGWPDDVTSSLMILTYLGLGVWNETAGRHEGSRLEDLFPDSTTPGSRIDEFAASSLQIQWIVAMVDTLHACGGPSVIYNTLNRRCESDFRIGAALDDRGQKESYTSPESLEMWCCLTLLYLFIEVARTAGGEHGQRLKKDIVALEPKLLNFFTQLVAKQRWEENLPIPLTKMLLLSWKTILVTIGGIKDVEVVKTSLRTNEDAGKNEIDIRGQPVITASPLDYHLFRQEISSKYPAYHPPPPLFPLEPENNTILPPLKHRQPPHFISSASDTPFTGAPSVGTASIMHQPVHIATPAPSPPPSPAGPGKAGKKQNYQTNQLFPFLYPPLDATSNELGGKGTTELQDLLVGRRWEGGDIPASILEAGELFAKRMRATRAMRQLWQVRVEFMKTERGWKADKEREEEEVGRVDGMMTLDDLRELGLDGLDLNDPEPDPEEAKKDDKVDGEDSPEHDFEILDKPEPNETAEQGQPLPQSEEQRRLSAVNDFYRDSLPHLQSLVIVLLKAVLNNVTDHVTKNGQNGLQAGIQFPNEVNGIGNTSAKPIENGIGPADAIENTAEEIDKLRSQEIAAKALSAILLLLLKWFKVSHILQYEYLTQLLLDSNYVPLILKLWQTQEVGRSCHFRLDREESEFFFFCREDSRNALPKRNSDATEDESEDEAMPPPIKLKRDTPEENNDNNPLSPVAALDFGHPPEVDELGYPMTPMPPSPIKLCSWRNIFTHINYLRVLQKVTRRKTHRALMLVTYKSSNHLKKTLKTPIHLLRYYTLKLFKSQVPFCGRKWRQANMKIITAVWLSVPAELRDDWLSGGGGGMGGACVGDVDGTVEDALPLEQSLRALTHWWNVRNYPEGMGVDKGLVEDEIGFFERELSKMDGAEDAQAVLEEEARLENGVEGWQGPIEGY